MKKGIHPSTKFVTVTCSNCKTPFEILSTKENIKIELCSHCHPFYTGEQKIIDTANKVKDFERRRNTAEKLKETPKVSKVRKSNKVTEVRADKPLTLRDMLKSVQG